MGYLVFAAVMGVYPFLPQPQVVPRNLRPPAIVIQPRVSQEPKLCAIPLTNVLRRNWGYDRMVVPRLLPQRQKAEVVEPPAPSCDDVQWYRDIRSGTPLIPRPTR